MRSWFLSCAIVSAPFFYSALAEAQTALAQTQLLVDLRDDTDDDDERAVEAELGGLDLRLNSVQAREERLFIADVAPEDLPRLIAALKNDDRVEHAEENTVYSASFVPDDPRFGEQWSLKMVKATEAWDGATGKGAVVAVIDTGIAYKDFERFKQVEDLVGASFVDGYDFVNDRVEALDDHGHGTHVAGTIAQRTNNGKGVAGLAYEATLMPLKVLSASGSGTAADIADAAADAQAKPWKAIPSGAVTRRVALITAFAFTIVGLTLSATLGLHAWAIGVAGLSCGLVYDVWLKRTQFSWLPYAVAFPLLPIWVFVSTDSWSNRLWWVFPLGGVLGFALHLANQSPDIEGDRAAGAGGFAERFGEERAGQVACALFATCGLVATVVVGWGSARGLLTTGAVVVALVAATVVRRRGVTDGLFTALAVGSAAMAVLFLSAI